MTANPEIGPQTKDDRPTHKGLTPEEKSYAKYRPCEVCMKKAMDVPHHLIARSHFSKPGIAKTYYSYLALWTGECIFKAESDNLCALCWDCHEQWHIAFGQVPPIGPMQKEIRARMLGMGRWRKHIEENKHRKLRISDIMGETLHGAWLEEFFAQELAPPGGEEDTGSELPSEWMEGE